jgi:hypothetical protein
MKLGGGLMVITTVMEESVTDGKTFKNQRDIDL